MIPVLSPRKTNRSTFGIWQIEDLGELETSWRKWRSLAKLQHIYWKWKAKYIGGREVVTKVANTLGRSTCVPAFVPQMIRVRYSELSYPVGSVTVCNLLSK